MARRYGKGLVPILCVGEQLAEREAGRTREVVARQLDAVLELCGAGALEQGVIAYEPVWAIGTGRNASPEQAQDVHAFIRARIGARDARIAAATRILYGGSVKAGNAAELFAMPDVDGGLIGGASLKADEFLAILAAARIRKSEIFSMLRLILTCVQVFSSFAIVGLVLLQRGKGAEAGAGFGAGASGTVFGARGATHGAFASHRGLRRDLHDQQPRARLHGNPHRRGAGTEDDPR